MWEPIGKIYSRTCGLNTAQDLPATIAPVSRCLCLLCLSLATCLAANPADKAANCMWFLLSSCRWLPHAARTTNGQNMSRHKARLSKQISRYTRTANQMDVPKQRAELWLQYNYATMGDKLKDAREKATKSQSLWHLRWRHAWLSGIQGGVLCKPTCSCWWQLRSWERKPKL